MKVETSKVSAQFVNSSFIRKLEEGRTKEAQDQGTAFIRQKMRQAAIRSALSVKAAEKIIRENWK